MTNFKILLVAIYFSTGVLKSQTSALAPLEKSFAELYFETLKEHECTYQAAYECSKAGHGYCVFDDVCICDDGFAGERCTENLLRWEDEGMYERHDEPSPIIRRWMEFNDVTSVNVTWPTYTGITKEVADSKCQEVYGEKNPYKTICHDNRTMVEEEIWDKCMLGIQMTGQLNGAYAFFLDYVTGISCSYVDPEMVKNQLLNKI
ncbi:hypothetical protein HELRODRAFT_174106 [Helobdella robusta]|uniref:EGF-like domain-containing protein n=1 Tax=Helobdella robusta TaxID=6412 RepID=T1F7M1_HELRO|nr:hypothetical protein HELRODRAFT_174106 [Helobdella robusta]ESO03207.1 hypothetical protein HELRODRAFT_174106 [Helobdella robusta]